MRCVVGTLGYALRTISPWLRNSTAAHFAPRYADMQIRRQADTQIRRYAAARNESSSGVSATPQWFERAVEGAAHARAAAAQRERALPRETSRAEHHTYATVRDPVPYE